MYSEDITELTKTVVDLSPLMDSVNSRCNYLYKVFSMMSISEMENLSSNCFIPHEESFYDPAKQTMFSVETFQRDVVFSFF